MTVFNYIFTEFNSNVAAIIIIIFNNFTRSLHEVKTRESEQWQLCDAEK